MLFGQAAGIWTRGSKNADKNSLDGGGSLDSVVRPPRNTPALEVERSFLKLVAPFCSASFIETHVCVSMLPRQDKDTPRKKTENHH
jgi:hypothetical protein